MILFRTKALFYICVPISTLNSGIRLRIATPLEEVNRSWNKPPNFLDMQHHRDLIDKFQDPDKDDIKYR